jgi:Glycine-zipper domain
MNMRRIGQFVPLVAAAALAGCVTVPTGPRVMALPGTHKSFEQFQADDVSCRQYAQYSIGVTNPSEAANNAAAANAAIGAGLGAAAGAIIGSVSGNAGPGAAIGAGTGLLIGSASGANAAGYTYYQAQRQYDAAYLQCMYAKGNQVPLGPRYGRRPYGYPPPGALPPPAG